MQISEHGIVLHAIKYSDSSRIVKVFTRHRGLQTIMVRTGRKAQTVLPLLQPLSLIEFSYRPAEHGHISSASHLERTQHLALIPADLRKTAIAIFIAEVLLASLHEEESNQELYQFVRDFICSLESAGRPADYHIWFLVHYARHLGIMPFPGGGNFFDLHEGCFLSAPPAHPMYLDGTVCEGLRKLLSTALHHVETIKLSGTVRRTLLSGMVLYLHHHIEGLREFRSLAVLEELFGTSHRQQ